MSEDDQDAKADKKTTLKMESRDVHFHVLDLVLPADWERVTPQVWTKDHDSLETYEATVDGHTLQVDFKPGEIWIGRLETEDGTRVETEQYNRQADAVRALVELLEAHAG